MAEREKSERLEQRAKVDRAVAWLEREKRMNAPPAIRFYAMQMVGKAIREERLAGGGAGTGAP